MMAKKENTDLKGDQENQTRGCQYLGDQEISNKEQHQQEKIVVSQELLHQGNHLHKL